VKDADTGLRTRGVNSGQSNSKCGNRKNAKYRFFDHDAVEAEILSFCWDKGISAVFRAREIKGGALFGSEPLRGVCPSA
jgi:hypothetical protein